MNIKVIYKQYKREYVIRHGIINNRMRNKIYELNFMY